MNEQEKKIEIFGNIKITIGITMLVFLIILMAGSASAVSNHTVCPGDCIYSSIQEAIDSASSGDTIEVNRGTYYENVDVNKQLILKGIGSPVVDADGSGNAITLSTGNSTIEGFMITGGGSDGENSGIFVNSNDNLIRNNIASNNDRAGIYLHSSSNNTLNDNIASNNGDGIYLHSSSNNTLNGNIASNNDWIGIDLYYSSNNMLINNVMTENKINFQLEGLTDSNFQNQIDKSNLVNRKPIYYINSDTNTIYDSSTNAGTFYCINCLNVTIKDLILDTNGYGVFFWNTTISKIQNIKVYNNLDGIYLDDSSNNNTLSGNNASNNSRYGISLWHSSNNNTLSDNIASTNSDSGIYLVDSSNNKLNGNNASSNSDSGIHLVDSSNNKLNGNIASSNTWVGISLSRSSNNNTLSDNIASSNSDSGIHLMDSSNNKLSGNNASKNGNLKEGGGGIHVEWSINNIIYNNLFNNINNIKIIDSENRWNISQIKSKNIIGDSYLGGNFWANPDGTGFSQTCEDADNDGICDTQYKIGSNNIDYLPLAYKPLNILKGDLNNNGVPADEDDLVLMKRASIGEIQADSKYDLNNNGQFADTGDLVLMTRASIGEISLSPSP